MSKTISNDGATNKSVEMHPLVKMATEMKAAMSAADSKAPGNKGEDVDMIHFVGITEMATILTNNPTDKARDMENTLTLVRTKGRLVSHDPIDGLSELEAAGLVHVERALNTTIVKLTANGKEVIDLLVEAGLIKLRGTDRYISPQDLDLPELRE